MPNDTQTDFAVQPTRALPVSSARENPADLHQQVRAAQQMWMAALKVILADFETEADAKRYLHSVDGQMVLQLAGFDGQRLCKLSLDPLRQRLETKRQASAAGRAAATMAKVTRPPVPLVLRERQNGVLRPLRGSVTAQVWAICDELHAAGKATTTATVTAAAGRGGPAGGSIAGALVAWRKFHAAGPRG